MPTYSDSIAASANAPMNTPVPDRDKASRGIIFDLDDTLALTAPHWRHAEATLLNLLGYKWSEELSLKYKGMNTFDVAAIIHRELKPDLSLEQCRVTLRNALLESLDRGPIVGMPGALGCVRRAAQLAPLAIASGSPLSAIELILNRLEMTDLFEVKVSSESVAKGKPAPDVFLAAAGMLGVDPACCLVFEDSLVGAKAARSAGMACLVVPSIRPEEGYEIASRCFPSLAEITVEEMASYLPPPPAFQVASSRSRFAGAFSLLELLIGVAIVAVLTALGFVAVGASSEMKKQTVCVSNLRALAAGVLNYASEHNGAFPPPFGSGDAVTWDGVIMPYLNHHDLTQPNARLKCPADPRPMEVSPGKYRRSYKLSSQPAQNHESPMGVVGYYDDPSGQQKYLSVIRRQINLTHPADTILIFEHFTTNERKSQFSDHFQFSTSNSIGSGWRNKNRIVGYLPDGRFYHGKGIAFAMADGHVEIQDPSWAYTPHVRWDAVR